MEIKNLSAILSPDAYMERGKVKEKTEYIQGKMVELGGQSETHNLIANNFSSLLWAMCRKDGHKIYQSDLRVINPERNSFVFPDIVAVEGDPEFIDNSFDTVTNPKLIVEVLADKTAEIDRTAKFKIYQSLESFQEYVLVKQDRVSVERYFRVGDEWTYTSKTDISGSILLKSLGQEVALRDIYEDVQFREAANFGKN